MKKKLTLLFAFAFSISFAQNNLQKSTTVFTPSNNFATISLEDCDEIVDDDLFVGSYLITQTTANHAFNQGPSFATQVITISLGENPNERVFSAVYLQHLGLNQPASQVVFSLDCEDVNILGEIDTFLSCTQINNVTLGASSGNTGVYDETDDSSFTLILAEFITNGGCPVNSPLETAFTLTKLECDVPENITIGSTTTNTVSITWNDSNPDEANQSWEVEYGLAGFTPSTGTSLTSTQTNLTIEGLLESTAYDLYIKSICDDDLESPLAGPISFITSTDCATFYPSNFPLLEDFSDNEIEFLNCYTVIDGDNNGNSWIRQELEVSPGNVSFFSTNGLNAGTKEDYLISPAFNLNSNNTYSLSLKYNGANSGSGTANENLEVLIATEPSITGSTNGISIFSQTGIVQSGEFADIENLAYTASEEFSVPENGEYYIVFKSTGSPLAGAQTTGFLLLFEYELEIETLSNQAFIQPNFSFFNTSEVLTIEAENFINEIEIYSISGKRVANQASNTSKETVNISQLSKGLYLAKVKTEAGIETFKFVK